MAQQAVDQQAPQQQQQQQQQPSGKTAGPTSAPGGDPTANLLYSENNNISGNNNNPGVVGSGRAAISSGGTPGSGLTGLSQPPAPTGEAHIPPLLGVAPLGPVALSKEQQVRVSLCLFARLDF